MLTVRVYDNYNLIALQGLDTCVFKGCEFSKKFRAETSGNMEKAMACVGHWKSFKLLKNPASLPS